MYKKILINILLLFPLFAKGQPCGTVTTPEDVNRLGDLQADFRNFEQTRTWGQPIKDIPIQFHIVRSNDGDYGLDERILTRKIHELNDAFNQANLRFIKYDTTYYIDNSDFVSYNHKTEENELAEANQIPNVINVFCVPNMGNLCGYAYFPNGTPASERVFMANDCMENNSTFTHEIGHFFGLYHTHGTTNNGTTNEYVSRRRDRDGDNITDCQQTGDECCDTPADPNLGRYEQFCLNDCAIDNYFTLHDPEGKEYKPMITNFMSYNPYKNCRNEFTNEQYARVAVVANSGRGNLKIPEDYQQNQCSNSIEGTVAFKLSNQNPMQVRKDGNLYRFVDSYQNGDTFTFYATNDSDIPLNLYILNMDTRKEVAKVFPYHSYEKPVIKAGGTYYLGGNITLSGISGKEYACLLYTEMELDLEQIVTQLESIEGTFTQRLYNALGDKLLPTGKVSYEEGIKVQFEGCLSEGEILPVMLEMDKI